MYGGVAALLLTAIISLGGAVFIFAALGGLLLANAVVAVATYRGGQYVIRRFEELAEAQRKDFWEEAEAFRIQAENDVRTSFKEVLRSWADTL